MSMVNIFVEGKGDEKFIDKYILYLSLTNIDNYTIIKVRGWTNLHNVVNKFKENSDSGGKNLVIFDADASENGGGINIRAQDLNSKKAELGIDFELFLFPNNSSDGDYELLLENIVNSQHIVILQCYDQYESCIRSNKDSNNNLIYSLPTRKAKIYSYIDAFPKNLQEKEEFKRGNYFFENSDIWDLNSVYLTPLRNFLLAHLTIGQSTSNANNV